MCVTLCCDEMVEPHVVATQCVSSCCDEIDGVWCVVCRYHCVEMRCMRNRDFSMRVPFCCDEMHCVVVDEMIEMRQAFNMV